jgi:hypothetical protein
MAKRKKKNIAITNALMIYGIALISEITAILSPSFLDISLNGLKTLSIRMTLMNSMLNWLNRIEIRDNIMMMKSMMFQDTLKYEFLPLNMSPFTMILIKLSHMKNDVITISKIFNIYESLPLGSFNGLSIAIVTVEMKIIDRMKPSKYHLFSKTFK